MQICGSQYGVFISGHWHWFSDRREAMRAEAEALTAKVQRKLQAGGTVILTRDMWKQVEAVQRSATDTTLNQNAH